MHPSRELPGTPNITSGSGAAPYVNCIEFYFIFCPFSPLICQ